MAEERLAALRLMLGGDPPHAERTEAGARIQRQTALPVFCPDASLTQARPQQDYKSHSTSNDSMLPSSTSIAEIVEPVENEQRYYNTSRAVQRATLLRGPLSPADVLTHASKQHQSHDALSSTPVHITASSQSTRFCPLAAVAKFPYKFVGQSHRQLVASAFFDAEKIWNRRWDLYYIWHSDRLTPQPVIFVAATQVQELIDDINKQVPELQWAFKTSDQARGLLLDFDSELETLRPFLLGRSNNRAEHDSLRDSVQGPTPKSPASWASDVQLFCKNLDKAVDAGKNKSRLSAATTEAIDMRYIAAASQLDLVRVALRGNTAASDKDVMFIAIDLEAYERDKSRSRITEVGIATLDTRDLAQTPPGQYGKEWHSFIHARHFLVKENMHLVNKDFVKGCPDRFDFGKSEIVAMLDLPSVLASCFRPPYGGLSTESPEKRDIVLVGHGINGDIDYCRSIGFSVLNSSSIVKIVDTAEMDRVVTGQGNSRSLSSIVTQYNHEAWNPHNAGNDAVYTIWAMLDLAGDQSGTTDSMMDGEAHHQRLKRGEGYGKGIETSHEIN